MVNQTVVIFSHRYLDGDCINFKTFYFISWLFIGPSEHHHTTQTSMFNKFLNGTSTMLNSVFFIYPAPCTSLIVMIHEPLTPWIQDPPPPPVIIFKPKCSKSTSCSCLFIHFFSYIVYIHEWININTNWIDIYIQLLLGIEGV